MFCLVAGVVVGRRSFSPLSFGYLLPTQQVRGYLDFRSFAIFIVTFITLGIVALILLSMRTTYTIFLLSLLVLDHHY